MKFEKKIRKRINANEIEEAKIIRQGDLRQSLDKPLAKE